MLRLQNTLEWKQCTEGEVSIVKCILDEIYQEKKGDLEQISFGGKLQNKTKNKPICKSGKM